MTASITPTIPADQPIVAGRPPARPLSAKRAARRTAVLEMLVDPAVVPEDVRQLNAQVNEIYQAFKPRNGWQDWLTNEIAVILLRINRCTRIERKMRDWASYRALDFWEDDQKLEVETLALRLPLDPARVVAELRQSPAGIAWLSIRWRLLNWAEASRWTADQQTLARRLLGGDLEIDLTVPGFVEARLGELEALRDRVEQADSIARGLVEADLNDDAVPNLARLRRYARSLHRQMKWYIDQFHVEHPDRWDDPRRRAAYVGSYVSPSTLAESVADKTNPTEAAAAIEAAPEPENDETKPFEPAAVPEPKNDETKPFEPIGTRGRVALVTPGAAKVEPVAVHDYSTEPGANARPRKRRVDPVAEVARREKTARRRRAASARQQVD